MNESADRTVTVLSISLKDNNENATLTDGESSNSDILNVKETDEELERKHFQKVVQAFKSYQTHSIKRLHSSLRYIRSLPTHQQLLLKAYKGHLDCVKSAIEHNHHILQIIVKDAANMFYGADHSNDMSECEGVVRAFDMEKVQSVLKQLCREWSSEGRGEREASFGPILQELSTRFSSRESRSAVQVLVPGAGVGRLAFEIAKMGFSCQGNEFSFFMLFTSNFILNNCQGINLYKIYPWVHQYHNNRKSYDQIESVDFPDVDPSDVPTDLDFSMAAGSFLEIYNKTLNTWDCICSCFFLDTANNVLDYIETTWKILKPGGYWINLGPLLYHHADMPNQMSIEPSYEEIRDIILKYGFIFLSEELNLPTPYAQNPRSMISYVYHSIFFVCQKPPIAGPEPLIL